MHKTLNYSVNSSKKNRQHESNEVNNTATKHLLRRNLPMRNASFCTFMF